MKRTLPIALVTALALCLVALPAFAHEAGSTFEITVVKARQAPVLDGVLDDAAWLDAKLANSVAATMVSAAGDILPLGHTVVFATWTDDALYLAYVNYRDMSKAIMVEDGVVSFGGEEEIEFFVDPKHDHASFIQFAWDAYGAKYATAGYSTEGIEVATSHHDFAWVAEIKIPWANMLIEPAEGLLFGANVNAYTSTEDAKWMAWNPTFGSFLNPLGFGGFVLGGAR